MPDDKTPRRNRGASWSLPISPAGMIYSFVDEIVRPLGHRVVGVVTSPGPKRRRSPTYLEVVAAVLPGVDVIVSNHPERWAAMLAPLRPDLIISGGFPWRIPADVLALPRLGAINFHDALAAATSRPKRDRVGLPHGRRGDGHDHSPPHPRVRRRPDSGSSADPNNRRRRLIDAHGQTRGPCPGSFAGTGTDSTRGGGEATGREPGDRGRAIRGCMADHRLEAAGADHSQPGAQLGRVA